jgi:hypothetical protein
MPTPRARREQVFSQVRKVFNLNLKENRGLDKTKEKQIEKTREKENMSEVTHRDT